ncbi:cytochrome c oxidase subunit 4 [Janibacter sp. G1551]|uniref:cytochrome c oxidase subunit 4 n=1 Tax=Janibacter sp. G1551 TaxID=3420440 RepID=UPI003CFF52F9
MQAEFKLFALLGIFFIPVTLLYGFWSEWEEPVGALGFPLLAGMCFMVAWYLWMTAKGLPDRPEDNLEGEIEEQAGEYGVFAPHSWWPLWLALTGSLLFLGLAVGWWVFIIGAFFGVFALVGWTFEFYKGEHSL